MIGDKTKRRTWVEWDWERELAWIPVRLRTGIEEFWLDAWGRGPDCWIKDGPQQKSEPTGTRGQVRLRSGEVVSGRWVHTWNNMGALVTDAGDPHHGLSNRMFHKGDQVPPAIRCRSCAKWVSAHARCTLDQGHEGEHSLAPSTGFEWSQEASWS